jgi:hypothetical protein
MRASFPQNPLGFRPSGTCLSRVVRANRLGKSVGSCSGGLMDQAPPRNHPSTAVAYRNVRIVSSAEPGLQLRRQIGLSQLSARRLVGPQGHAPKARFKGMTPAAWLPFSLRLLRLPPLQTLALAGWGIALGSRWPLSLRRPPLAALPVVLQARPKFLR